MTHDKGDEEAGSFCLIFGETSGLTVLANLNGFWPAGAGLGKGPRAKPCFATILSAPRVPIDAKLRWGSKFIACRSFWLKPSMVKSGEVVTVDGKLCNFRDLAEWWMCWWIRRHSEKD